MRPLTTAFLIVALAAPLATLAPLPAEAGRIERACLSSDRPKSRTLCGCIQRVADQVLTRQDQRIAARFFREPQRAQDTRMSDDPGAEAFWKRYRAFGNYAAAACR
jgi:hypothetical protein